MHSGLPKILLPIVPARYLSNGELTTNLHFYGDRDHYDYAIETFQRKFGFKVEGKVASENPTTETTMLTKSLNGVKLKVRFLFNIPGSDRECQDSAIDIIGNRAHSFQRSQTFVGRGCRDQQKLYYDGSCGSYSALPGLMQEAHGGNYFMSVTGVGRGSINNHVLYYTMEAIAKGERSWKRVQKYVEVRMKKSLKEFGIIFPHDRSLLFFDFIARAERILSEQRGKIAAN